MSTPANARTLYTQIANDPDFRSKLAENSSPEVLIAEVQAYGKARGLSVSVEEIRQAMTPPERELSDQELEQVVGGKSIHCLTAPWDENEIIIGSLSADSQLGGSGHDDMYGLSGDDTMVGGDGRDYMRGGSGNDYMSGDDGYDTMGGTAATTPWMAATAVIAWEAVPATTP